MNDGEILSKWRTLSQLGVDVGRAVGDPVMVRVGKESALIQSYRKRATPVTQNGDSVIVSWLGGTFRIAGETLRRWIGVEDSQSWWPLCDARTSSDGFVSIQQFVKSSTGELATICSHDRFGAWWIIGQIREKWYQSGAVHGRLGVPVEDAWVSCDGQGHVQRFTAGGGRGLTGAIASHPDIGTFKICGQIFRRWADSGYDRGLGFPECDELTCGDGTGRYSQFIGEVRTRVYQRDNNTFLVRDPILRAWYELGAEKSALGYPTTEELDGPILDSREMKFEHGRIWTTTGGQINVEKSRGLHLRSTGRFRSER